MKVREATLNRTFVELADTLVGRFDVPELLHTLADRCVELFDVDAAGLMLTDTTGTLRVVASSDEQIRMLELFELQSQEGPCSEAFRTGVTITESDFAYCDRWPHFTEAALAAGYRAALAIPMSLRDEVIGALNLFRLEPGGLDASDEDACRALADVATIGLVQARVIGEARLVAEQLQSALNSRVVIEQAKGVLAGLANIDMDAAFRLLRRYARAENRLLADVARDVAGGSLLPSMLGAVDR